MLKLVTSLKIGNKLRIISKRTKVWRHLRYSSLLIKEDTNSVSDGKSLQSSKIHQEYIKIHQDYIKFRQTGSKGLTEYFIGGSIY